MHSTFALAALAAVAFARPQGVTQDISPEESAPEGCSPSYSGKFQIQAVNITTASTKAKRQSCGSDGTLTVELADGTLTDSEGRTGYIAANYQFQFDAPAQTGAIYTSGFSSCGNGSLALGGSAVFYQCYSGGFYNLYDRHWAEQCNPIYLDILPCGGDSDAAASQIGDGQPQVTTAVSAPISQIGDGQPQATTAVSAPISQIGDGQIQATTAVSAPASTPISQIGDGQIQVPTEAPAPSTPISQIGDGQIQVPTAAPSASTPISQIGDGQIQVPTAAPTPSVMPTGGLVSQIPDGQIQANATSGPVPFTGAASSLAGSQVAALFVAVVAVAFL